MFNFTSTFKFNMLPDRAFDELTGNEILTLGIIIREWSLMAETEGKNKGWYFRSISDLTKSTRLSNKTVIKCIESLVKKCYISKRYNNWLDGKANWYQLHTSLWEYPAKKPYEIEDNTIVINEGNGFYNPVKYQMLS